MIEVKHLYHSYMQNDQYAIAGVSFSVGKGEIFGFLGPNGAGKSTTQKILTGVLRLQKGTVKAAGVDVSLPGPGYYETIGVAFEQPNLYKKLSGLENLEFYRSLYSVPTEEPMSLLRLFGIADAARKMVGQYSKGMQQRLMLARSLINRPKIWFLDEPTSGLDPATARSVKDLIMEKKRQGMTIFLTTHDMHVADELCDRVAFINEGKITAIDTPRNLKLEFGEKIVRVEHRFGGVLERESLSLVRREDNKRLQQLLDSGTVETIHSQEATLEDVFIRITGRGLV